MLQPVDDFRADPHLGRPGHRQRQAFGGDRGLQSLEGLGNAVRRVVEDTGIDVGRGHHMLDAVGHQGPGQLQRIVEVARAVIDAGQDVNMKVKHAG